MSIEDVVKETLEQNQASMSSRMGATDARDIMPISLRLQMNIADADEFFSEEEVLWAAKQVGVADMEYFLNGLESWV